MVWCILFPILGVISLIFFLRERIRRSSALSLIWKTLTSVWFLALAFCAVWKASEEADSAGFTLLVMEDCSVDCWGTYGWI